MLLVGAGVVVGMRPMAAMADTLRVCATGCLYSDYTSIQAAIDAARTGDRILIAPGTYTETLQILPPVAAKTLTLIGSGAAQTVCWRSKRTIR
jgi:pectin methylesterase-like acyl-CoA thioesterase